MNPDQYISTGQGVLSFNMYAYCGNNPVNRVDPTGRSWVGVITVAVAMGLLLTSCTPNKKGGTEASFVPPPLESDEPLQPMEPISPLVPLSGEQRVLVATIAGEATVTAQNKSVSSNARRAMANVALNRVGKREWSGYTSVAEICMYTGFDAYGGRNYNKAMDYLNNRDGTNATYEAIIWDVLAAYQSDITNGAQLYYTPAAMRPSGSRPKWNYALIEEVIIPGVDRYYEGRFYRYK